MGLFDSVNDFLGTAVGGVLGGFGEKLFDNYSAASAATKSFDRQKWMAANAYQLKVEDLRKAGLNPALAYGGGGAAFPGVSTAQTSHGGAMSSAANIGLQSRQGTKLEQEVDAIGASIDTMITQQGLNKSATALNEAKRYEVGQVVKLMAQEFILNANEINYGRIRNAVASLDLQQQSALLPLLMRSANAETYMTELDVPAAEKSARMWRNGFGTAAPYIREVMPAVNGLLNALGIGAAVRGAVSGRKAPPTKYRRGNRTRRQTDGGSIETWEEQTDGY